MLGQGGGCFLEEALIVGGLLAVQCAMAGYLVFLNRVLELGASSLAVITIVAVASAVLFLPFAVVLERKKWPAKISRTLLAQFVLMAFGGITVFQELTLLGIEKTTPAIASAMPNLSPGLIFIIAACFRLEKFDKACKYTGAKILGTLVCLAGAMTMSFLRSPPSTPMLQVFVRGNSETDSYYDWILGCSYLFASVVILSCNTVLQAAALISFPAPLSMCVITSMMAAVFTAIVQVIVEGRISIGSSRIGPALIWGIVILGGGLVGSCIVFQTWCLGKKGPLLVSIFGPVQPVCSAILSAVLFGQMISLGSMAGIVLMFCGLYIVMWAKNNESIGQMEAADVEKALIS